MSQLSVPSSDVQNTETNGCVNTHPGASSFFEALADADETAYTNQNIITNVFNNEPDSVLRCGMQSIVDPGVDTGFTIRFIARLAKGVLNSNPLASITLENLGGFTIWTDQTLWSYLTTTFALYEFPLSEAEVQTLRSLGAWNDLTIRLRGHNQNINVGTPNADLAFAFVQLEAPLAGPGPDIEIEMEAGFDFGGSNYFEVVSDAELIFDGSAIILLNTFISDAGLVFDCSAVMNLNAYISDAGLIFDTTPQNIVLSADCSGIYTLIPGQHFDEILSRNTADNETQDVKIPDPQGKTGFFGG